jgi:hypothetical protein
VARETKRPLNPPVTYTKRVSIDVPVERRTGGLFGFGARTEVVNERRSVDQVVEALGPHWVLDEREWTGVHYREGYYSAKIEDVTHAYSILALLPNGRLVYLTVTEDRVREYQETQTRLLRQEFEHSCGEANEIHILKLDFEKRYTEWGSREKGRSVGTNKEPGKRLLHHAKGVGINLALKSVLER